MSITERLRDGQPPLRISELAPLLGYSTGKLRQLVKSGDIAVVKLRDKDQEEGRIAVAEARRLMVRLGILSARDDVNIQHAQFGTGKAASRSVN